VVETQAHLDQQVLLDHRDHKALKVTRVIQEKV
jgi:hypothetical protein